MKDFYVITGGGTGLGRALAIHLASLGHEVLIVGRRQATLSETASQHSNINFQVADVSSSEGRSDLVETLKDKGSIAGLIHNAGTIEPIAPITQLKLEDWNRCLATNLEPALCLTQGLLPQLEGGRVLFMSSGAAHFAVSGWAAYCVSKAGLSMLSLCWKEEVKQVAFASVMPGIIDTPMQGVIRGADHMEHDKLEFFHALKKQGKLLAPETVAIFLGWLLIELDKETFSSQEWDIYDTSHHSAWLRAPHTVSPLD